MQKISKFWDKHAEGYSRQPIADIASYEHKLDKTREYFTKDTKILEIGCGTGSTAILHAPHVSHILATDVSAKMLEIANNKTKKEKISNITFKQVEALDISLTEPVDVVMTMSLLHLVKDKEALIEKIYTWLKPGGVFVSSTGCLADSPWRHIRIVAPLARLLGLIPMFKIFSGDQLCAAITDVGFTIDYVWKPEKGPVVFIVAKKN